MAVFADLNDAGRADAVRERHEVVEILIARFDGPDDDSVVLDPSEPLVDLRGLPRPVPAPGRSEEGTDRKYSQKTYLEPRWSHFAVLLLLIYINI
jgi:hypothetical protein